MKQEYTLEDIVIIYNEVLKYPHTFTQPLQQLKSKLQQILSKEGKARAEGIKLFTKNLNYQQYTSRQWYLLGRFFIEALKFIDQGIIFLNNALLPDIKVVDTYRVLGDVYALIKKDAQKGIDYYEKFITLEPNNWSVYNTLGHLYEQLDKYNTVEKQLSYFRKAHELNPNVAEPLRNIGIVAPRINREDEAFIAYHKLFKQKIAKPDDYFDYSCLKIKKKNFQEGWKYYEARFEKTYGATPYPKFKQPRWQGKKILGKTLLINWEQGFGDSIQFSRYLKQVKPLVGKIIFRVQNSLASFFKQQEFFEGIEVIGEEPLESLNFDYQIPLMSLPYVLHATINNIPYPEGHLQCSIKKVEEYLLSHCNLGDFKIGISWYGMPTGNLRRNVPLETFYPLARLKGVQLYSFQKNAGQEQLQQVPEDIKIIDLGSTFLDWEDTSGAMGCMDLFITSDNAVFNFAATLGLETCLLLSQDAEWRWFNEDKFIPWYSNVEVFKKKHENAPWDSLIEDIIRTKDLRGSLKV